MYLRRIESTIVVSDAFGVCADISMCNEIQAKKKSLQSKKNQSVRPETFVCVNTKKERAKTQHHGIHMNTLSRCSHSHTSLLSRLPLSHGHSPLQPLLSQHE